MPGKRTGTIKNRNPSYCLRFLIVPVRLPGMGSPLRRRCVRSSTSLFCCYPKRSADKRLAKSRARVGAMKAATKDAEAARFFELWADELAGAALYRALAERASEQRRGVLLELAAAEERHAAHWARLMAERGLTDPKRPPLPLRVRA